MYSRQPVVGRVFDKETILPFPAFFLAPELPVTSPENADISMLSNYLNAFMRPGMSLKDPFGDVSGGFDRNLATIADSVSVEQNAFSLSFRPKSGFGVIPVYFLPLDIARFARPELEEVLLQNEFPVYKFAKSCGLDDDCKGLVRFQKC